MKEMTNKPTTLVRQEFIDTIYKDINNSNLPLFVIEPILKDIYMEVKSLSQQQYELEKAEYERKLADSQMGDINETKQEKDGNE